MLVIKWEQVVEVRIEVRKENIVFSSVENASSLLGLDVKTGLCSYLHTGRKDSWFCHDF